ncbi:hypothetical protein OIU78_013969 [Salix suchowensis]|nr:hypothetical protein OIU78_013969 [Salix suchowensis]
MKGTLCFSVLFIALFFSADANGFSGGGGGDCVYALYVKTGSIMKAGTDSKISLVLGDAQVVEVRASAHPICSLNLTSDGQGSHHGWYCDYVEVTSTGPHKECGQTIFYVDQWLAADAPPFKLTALLDGCRIGDDDVKKGKHGKFVVENVRGFDFA